MADKEVKTRVVDKGIIDPFVEKSGDQGNSQTDHSQEERPFNKNTDPEYFMDVVLRMPEYRGFQGEVDLAKIIAESQRRSLDLARSDVSEIMDGVMLAVSVINDGA